MPNFTLIASPPPLRMKPVSTRTLLSSRRASTKEKGRSTISSNGAPCTSPAMRWSFERANSMTWTSQPGLLMACSAFCDRAPEAREPDRDDQDGALENILREGRGAEDVQAVEAEGDDERTDQRAKDVELAV